MKRSKQYTGFRRGVGVKPCGGCGRLTKGPVGVILDHPICPECYELAGIENQITDEGINDKLVAEARSLVDAAVKAGGSREKIVGSFWTELKLAFASADASASINDRETSLKAVYVEHRKTLDEIALTFLGESNPDASDRMALSAAFAAGVEHARRSSSGS